MEGLSQEEIQKLNKIVRIWGSSSRKDMLKLIPTRKSERRKGDNYSLKKVKTKFKYDMGMVEAIGFEFPRHGVFVEMGVYGGYSKSEKTFPHESWFNITIDNNLRNTNLTFNMTLSSNS